MNINEIISLLSQKCQVDIRQALVVGVSGGPDSLCLLDLLHRRGYKLVVAHLDHQLRPESAAEAQAVRQATESRGLPFIIERKDINAYAQESGLSVEEAARAARYQFLFKVAEEMGAQAVAVAHNADDQVETVLMHLLRGSGLAGLRGMSFRSLPNPWSKTIPLVRPLLGVFRSEIDEYLSEQGLTPIQDASNLDPRYTRNRIRHELIPLLQTYNPNVRGRLWQMAESLAFDYDFIEQHLERAWTECLVMKRDHILAFDLAGLQALPETLLRHLLRRATLVIRPSLPDLDYNALLRGVRLVRGSVGGFEPLANGLGMLREYELVWLTDNLGRLPVDSAPQLLIDQAQAVHIPGAIALSRGWQLEVERQILSAEQVAELQMNPDPYQAWLDAEKVTEPLFIRPRKAGDRIAVLGMQGHALKVSDLMINQKIPARARPHWPVVVCGAEIAWIPGLRLADPYKLQPNSRRAIHLRAFRRLSPDA